jgi:hypothetical protein
LSFYRFILCTGVDVLGEGDEEGGAEGTGFKGAADDNVADGKSYVCKLTHGPECKRRI